MLTARDLDARLAAIGSTRAAIAEFLNRHPEEIDRLLNTGKPLPRFIEKDLEWALACFERDHAMEQSGLPPCPWMEDQVKRIPTDHKQLEAFNARLEQHVAQCPTCQARNTYADRLPPLPPMPLHGWMGVLVRVHDAIAKLPKPLRPAANGAIVAAAITAFRSLFMLIGRGPAAKNVAAASLAILAAAYAGAVAGFAYHLAEPHLHSVGRFRPYALGMVCVYAFLLALAVPVALFANDKSYLEPGGLVLGLVLGAVFGAIVGHAGFRTGETQGGV